MNTAHLFSISNIRVWWSTLDRWALIAIFLLSLCGILLVSAASPAVATHIGLQPSHFILRHLAYLSGSLCLMLILSHCNQQMLLSVGTIGLMLSLFLLICTLFIGMDIKGARRWINIGGLSLQPSEFLKPCLILVTGWLFARFLSHGRKGALWINGGLLLLSLGLLLLQPDLGMSILLTSSWAVQLFLFGISIGWILTIAAAGVLAMGGAYLFLPHVHARINRFIGTDEVDRFGDGFQLSQSLEAFTTGGLFGKGPGEGVIKRTLPDAHADFIFAVSGEEFGLILSLFILCLFGYFLLRMVRHLFYTKNLFTLFAGTGLCVLFVFQAVINIASTLSLIPTKGMTLPLISYGGSSLISTGITLGFLFALTRRSSNEKQALQTDLAALSGGQ